MILPLFRLATVILSHFPHRLGPTGALLVGSIGMAVLALPLSPTVSAAEFGAPVREIVFIDQAVADHETLVAAVRPGVEIVLLDPTSDELAQVAKWAESHSGYQAMHLVSHGTVGQLQLGSRKLGQAALSTTNVQSELVAIGQALEPGGDLLFYGCNLGAGQAGAAFLDQLSRATGADVAASDDPTGSAMFGGDWVLEAQRGQVTAETAFVSPALGSYVGLLAVSDQNFDSAGLISAVNATSQPVGTWTFSAASAVDMAVANSNETVALLGGANDRVFIWNLDLNDGVANVSQFSFASTDGTNFDLNSFSLAASSNDVYGTYAQTMSVTISGWRDGSQVVAGETVDLRSSDSAGNITYTMVGTGTDNNVFQDFFHGYGQLSFASAFDSVDEIRMAFGGTVTAEVDDIDITVASAAAISSAAYNASTGVLSVTGSGMTTGDTIDPTKLTVTGSNGGTYTLTSSSVTASSATTFSITLNAADRVTVNGLWNYDGTTAVNGTTYNLSAASSWDATASAVADTTNGVTVNSVATPTITSATYDASTNVLVVTGTRLVGLPGSANDITVGNLRMRGEGATTYTLTTGNVDVTSETSFSVTLNATDEAAVELLFNRNGTTSTDISTYTLSTLDYWNTDINDGGMADSNNVITVSNVPVPAITIATYDASTGVLAVTGTGFTTRSGTNNDIDITKLTLSGEGGASYTLTTSNVDITNGTSFSVTLNATDRAAVNLFMNRSGISSTSGTTYNLVAAEDWARGAATAVTVADTTGNGVIATVPAPIITSATYDASTGALVVTGTGFVSLAGSANDIDIGKFSVSGDSIAYPLTSSSVDVTSATSFTVTLNSTDIAALTTRLNQNGTSSEGEITYNLAAAEDWARGADTAVTVADTTGNGITVSNFVNEPTVGVVVADNALSVGETSLVTFTFSEAVTGFDNSDVSVANGTLSTVSSSDGGVTWTATLTPTASVTDATNVISMAMAGVTSVATSTAGSGTTNSNNYAIDTVRPTVSSVNSSTANATYKLGDTISIQVNFTETVTVTNTPQLTLETGAIDRVVSYISGSGTSALNFNYIVQAGDTSADLDYQSTTALALNGGTIKDAAGNDATLTLAATGAAGSLGDNQDLVVDGVAPTVTDANISISGASGTGGAFKIGNTVTATWNNTAGGDNNSDISGVTVNFSAFGGGAAVAASNSGGTWTATYTIISGAIDSTNLNVSVTATDNAGNSTTTADSTNATVDNTVPTVTDGNISISGATGTGGAFKIGDTVTATWNNTAGGDNNSDTISGVTADFSAFGGGAAVAATNAAGIWTATYSIVAGAIDATNRNVSITATDNAGNATTTADTANATVDSIAPTVTDGNISISGGSGAGGAFLSGDTLTATWDNTGTGDNNADTISAVAVNFSAFGGGAAVAASNSGGTWTATYSIVGASSNGSNLNVSITATDNAGNTKTTADTTNATVDTQGPGVTGVSSSTANGSYKAGAAISIQVSFGEAVTVTGTPQLTLETGATDRTINYASGSGTTTLTFAYTVQAGDTSADLDYTGTGSLALNGGTVKDSVGNDATLTLASPGAANSLGANEAIVIDTTAPLLSSIARQSPTDLIVPSGPVTYRVTFNDTVTGGDVNDFTLTSIGGSVAGTIGSITPVSGLVYDVAVTSLSGDGQLRLDLKNTGTGISDTAGNALADGGFATGDFFVVGATSVFDAHTLTTAATVTASLASTNRPAQRFTTGAGAPLTLTKVAALLHTVTGTPTPVVTIRTNAAGIPGTVLATLTNPAALTAGAYNVWTGNVTLDPSTTYWVVFGETATAYGIDVSIQTAGGSGTWLSNPDYLFRYGTNSGTTQTGALKLAIGGVSTPAITSALTASGTYGTAIVNYTITASASPTSYAATGLPGGLSLNTTTGVISGTPTAAGSFNVTLTATNNSGTSNPATLVLTIAKAPLTVTASSASRTYGDPNPAFTVAYSGFRGGDSVASLTTAPTAATAAGPAANVGTYAVAASGGVDDQYAFNYVDGVLTITPAPQTITFAPSPSMIIGGTLELGGTASSGLPVSIELVSGPASLSGGILTATGAGTVTVRATQAGDGNRLPAAAVERTIVVGKLAQTIAFTAPAERVFGSAPFALAATATSGLPVAFEVVSGPASLSGSTLTLTGAGTVTIAATQLGNDTYGAASSVTRSFTVTAATQAITFASLPNTTFGTAPIALAATASSGLPVTYTVEGPASVSGSTLTLTGAGTVTVTALQLGNANYNAATEVVRSFAVAKATAPVSLAGLAATYDGAEHAVSVTTTPADLPVTVTYAGSTTAPTAAGSYAVSVSVASADYTGTATGTLVIAKALPAISWPAPAPIVYGTALSAAHFDATAGIRGAFTPAPALGSVLHAGAHTLTVHFTPEDGDNYSATSASVPLTVEKRDLTVRATDANVYQGQPFPVFAVQYSNWADGDGVASLHHAAHVLIGANDSSVTGTYPLIPTGAASDDYAFRYERGTLTIVAPGVPVIVDQPDSTGVVAGGSTNLSVGLLGTGGSLGGGAGPMSYQWYNQGNPVPGGTGASLPLGRVGPGQAGIYDCIATGGSGSALSAPALVGVTAPQGQRTVGAVDTRDEWQAILHPNGNVYDQFLLAGSSGVFTAGPDKIARISFLDENESIVQVEVSGHGSVVVILDNAQGPMAPALYHQPAIRYMKGRATVIVTGADETTHFTIYSVGTMTNPGVTSPEIPYEGWAELAAAGVISTNGKLGGVHMGNVRFSAKKGTVGFFAPEVHTVVNQPVVIHDIAAEHSGTPMLYFAAEGAVTVKIAGGDLRQTNQDIVFTSGVAQVQMAAGRDSCGEDAPAQTIATRLIDPHGNDITGTVVTGP